MSIEHVQEIYRCGVFDMQQGAKDGLIAFAKETGNPIPAAVLYGVGDEESGLEAAVGAYKRTLKSPVLEFWLPR